MPSQTSLEQILDHSPSIIFTKDLEGRYVFVNRQFERAAGRARAEIIGRTARELFPLAVAGRLLENDRRVLEARRPLDFEDEIRVGGKLRIYLSSVFPLLSAAGEPYGLSGILRDITERKRAEEGLRRAALAISESEDGEVLESLAGSVAGILGVDVGFISAFADPERAQMRMLAFHMDGQIRAPFTYALTGTPCAVVVGREFHCFPSGAARLFPRDDMFGKAAMDSYAAYPLNDAGGRPLGLIGAMHRGPLHDVGLAESILKIFAARASAAIERQREAGQRKSAEEALRASESRYRAIFNAAADSMVLRDAEFRVVDVNPAYEQMSRRKRAEALGRSDLTMSPPELTARVRELHARALAGEPVMFEARARRKDGEEFDIETRGVPILHEGRPHVLYIGRDITARKSDERALRASEAQYRAIFNAAADALVLRDADFRIVDVNPAYEAMSGYSREEVVGLDRVVANPAEAEEHIRALHRKALAGEQVVLETVRVSKSGVRREVELRGVPIQHRGQPHVLYIGRDISARKRAEEERSRLEAQLRQAQRMEAIGRLTGGIAHDFNNLLASIMGFIVLAAERPAAGNDAKLAAHLEQALASSRRARDLVQQMLTFSRGKRGAPRALHLGAAAEESLKLVRGSLPATVEIRTAVHPAAPAVLVDPVQLDQVLINLCINARDAMGGVGEIDVVARPAEIVHGVCASCRQSFGGRFAELAVRDSGQGIPAATLERIFEPFFTTKDVGRGSGMGLATVHGIVHEHGGHLLVETTPGEGACFRALFPILEKEVAPEVGRAVSSKPSRRRLAGRVLVVDDETSVGEFMRELLESWGLSASALASPLGVLERVTRERPAYDLVILDQTMPGMTGMSLARELSAARPGLPIILYTGRGDPIGRDELAAAGITALLPKPVEPEALYSLLEANLPA